MDGSMRVTGFRVQTWSPHQPNWHQATTTTTKTKTRRFQEIVWTSGSDEGNVGVNNSIDKALTAGMDETSPVYRGQVCDYCNLAVAILSNDCLAWAEEDDH